MKPETKFWHEIKKNTKQISWTRLENLSAFGTPDLLGYNTNSHFFTVELKVTKANKIKFSPHQIAFHVKHPDNTFILVSRLMAGGSKLFEKDQVYLYRGKRIQELVACGLSLDACRSGLDDCINHLERLGA
tara:strand:+ start:5884 stop:6276 length:393 start_codon:yes stop_codon:yes gene_type:complete